MNIEIKRSSNIHDTLYKNGFNNDRTIKERN